jgi:hypothetical protein
MPEEVPFSVLDDDIFLVAYPKSGNNLLLFLVGTLLYQTKIDWANKGMWVQNVREPTVFPIPSPRLVWSHESYDSTYPKVMYLIRDPRDIVISYYFHHLKYFKGEGFDLSFNQFFEEFMSGKVWPGVWDSNVESWIENQKNIKNGFLLLRYEDLLSNITGEVRRILEFLNLDRTEEEINDAIKWASFDNMKSLEKKQKEFVNWGTKFVDEKIPFVREGRTNGWKSVLDKEQQEKMNQEFQLIFKELKYEI